MNHQVTFIAAGVGGVVIAGIIGAIFGSVWTAFFTAILVAIVWLFYLDRNYISKLEPEKTKLPIRILLILLLASQAYLGVIGEMKSSQQNEILTTIRTTIDAGIIQTSVERTMINAFREYHMQPSGEATLEEKFRVVAGDKIDDNNRFIGSDEWEENSDSKYEVISSDEIRIITVAKIGKGQNPAFQNMNGETGMYQSTATLTKEGVSYVREN